MTNTKKIIVSMFAVIMIMVAANVLFLSCRNGNRHIKELSEIEATGKNQPDSALIQLESFDKQKLGKEEDLAYYYLVRAELRDKNNFVDTTTLDIDYSIRYFHKTNDSRSLMKSLFYKGENLKNSGNFGKALLASYGAAEIFRDIEAKDRETLVWGKKIYTSLSEIFEETGDRVMKMEYARRAWEMAIGSDSIPFINDASLWYAATLSENSHVREAVDILKGLLADARSRGDEDLFFEVASNLGNVCLWEHDFKEARMYLSLPIILGKDSLMTERDINFLLWSMVSDNAPLDSIRYVRESVGLDIPDESITYEYHLCFNDYEKAFRSIKSHNIFLNNQIKAISRSEASSMLSAMLEERRAAADREAVFQRNLNLLIWVSSFLLLSLVSGFFVSRIRGKNRKIQELIDKVGILGKERSSNGNQASAILSSMFSQLDSLYAEYYRLPSNDQKAGPLVSEMSGLIENIRKDTELLDSLEKEINQQTGNLLSEIYGSWKRLNENQRRLIVYLYFGLSVESICVLLNVTTEVFYNRKSRLKNTISGLTTPRRQDMLDLLFSSPAPVNN